LPAQTARRKTRSTLTSNWQNLLARIRELHGAGLGLAGAAHALHHLRNDVVQVQRRAGGVQRRPVGLRTDKKGERKVNKRIIQQHFAK